MRPIDADAFDKCLLGAEIEATKNQKYVFSSAINTIRGNLANAPTIEPQPEIIRCKNCKWFNKPGCSIWIVDDSDKPSEDDYCSFAELRGDSDE